MKQTIRGILFVAVAIAFCPSNIVADSSAPSAPWRLWYSAPAGPTNWTEALPIGNGRLGAMIFGGVERERIQLNEDTLWAGGPYDPANTNALAALPEVRRLIFAGQYTNAARLVGEQV